MLPPNRLMITMSSVVCALTLVTTLSAQDNQGNANPVLVAVRALQTTMNGLAITVGAFATKDDEINTATAAINTATTAINTATTEGTFLATPSIAGASPEFFICSATNVSSEPRNVQVQLVNGNTGAVFASNTSN